MTVSLSEMAEVIAIGHCEFLVVYSYCLPSSSDLTIFRLLDKLLDAISSLFPMICSDFNVHGHPGSIPHTPLWQAPLFWTSTRLKDSFN